MTEREIFERALRREPTPHPPFMVVAGHAWICQQEGITPRELMYLPDCGAQLLIDSFRKFETPVIFAGHTLGFFLIDAMGGKVNNDVVGGGAEVTEPPLKEPEDIDNYDVQKIIDDILASEDFRRHYEQVRLIKEMAGDEFLIAVGNYGPFTLASQMLGVENFMMCLMDDEDGYIEKMLHLANEVTLAFNRKMMEAGGDFIWAAEPVASGDLISQNMFEEFTLPIDTEMLKRSKEFCPYTMIHICGRTNSRVHALAESGFDCFAVDSIDMREAVANAGGKMTMLGNLNPTDIVLNLSADEVYQKSRELCESMKGEYGFILAPGCDLSPHTPLENIVAMSRAAVSTVRQ